MKDLWRVATILILTGVIAPWIINSEAPVTLIVIGLYCMAMIVSWLLKDPLISLYQKVKKALEDND